MREVKILIACGSGIATSTVAQERIKEILKEEKKYLRKLSKEQ